METAKVCWEWVKNVNFVESDKIFRSNMLGQHFSMKFSIACIFRTRQFYDVIFCMTSSFDVMNNCDKFQRHSTYGCWDLRGGGGTTPPKPFEYTERQNLRRVKVIKYPALLQFKFITFCVIFSHALNTHPRSVKNLLKKFWLRQIKPRPKINKNLRCAKWSPHQKCRNGHVPN